MMVSQKTRRSVTPAKAGVQKALKYLDSGFRRSDGIHCPLFCFSLGEGLFCPFSLKESQSSIS